MEATYIYDAGILLMIHHLSARLTMSEAIQRPPVATCTRAAPASYFQLYFQPFPPSDQRSVFHLTHFAGR